MVAHRVCYAQDTGTGGVPAAPAADSQAQSNENGLADIVVTAERRTNSLQRTGTALSVVTGDALIQQGVTVAQNLGRLVPALNVQDGGGANAIFFLRGVGNFTVNGSSDPAIAFIPERLSSSRQFFNSFNTWRRRSPTNWHPAASPNVP